MNSYSNRDTKFDWITRGVNTLSLLISRSSESGMERNVNG